MDSPRHAYHLPQNEFQLGGSDPILFLPIPGKHLQHAVDRKTHRAMIQVWQGIVIAPLIGVLDSSRTQGFMERLLNSIVENDASIALIDITGVPSVDTQTAQHLMETIAASKLLGARVILTGVRPAIAQTIVHLGIDLAGTETQSSLMRGVKLALEMLNFQVVNKNRK